MIRPSGVREVRELSWTVDRESVGMRLDQALARAFPEYSRSRLRRWIDAGRVRVDGVAKRARAPLKEGQNVQIEAILEPVGPDQPEPIPLEILYEDDQLLVINKPAGLVVHPGAGNRQGTLVNALLNYDQALACLPRAGLVHRLDKDTTGALIVARTPGAHAFLVAALARREIHRRYVALVHGQVVAGTDIKMPIGRHPTVRTRMAVNPRGRRAITHTRVAEHLGAFTLLTVELETGRTHQIRVHLAYLGTPIVGDPVYGRRGSLFSGLDDPVRERLGEWRRQALHATRVELPHPETGEPVAVEAPMPSDLSDLLQLLREQRG